ncbi:MAG: zinc-ribbon domain-containing protein [Desulfarculaceae bacterium]|jgi:ribosomal protein L37E
MECPHCHQPVPVSEGEEPKLLTCQSCGRQALPGANFCSHCGHELPPGPGEEPKLLTCASCGHKALPGSNYCPDCGESLAAADTQDDQGFDPDKRQACSDGMCIGIIGPDGRCTECGKPYQPE